MKDTSKMNMMSDPQQLRGSEEGLGANSDIGAKLRALYGAVQDEGIPESLLDLLERLDKAEQAVATNGKRD